MGQRSIELDCEEVWRHISNYLDKEVDPQLRFNLETHFKDCAHCTAILDGTRNVLKLVGDGRTFELPSKTSKRIYAKLDEHLGRNNPVSKER